MISKDDYGSSYSCDCNIMQMCPVELQGIPKMNQVTGAQKWHIVSLLGDVTSHTTVADYVSMTCSEHREALTAAPADGVHLQAIRVQE